MADKEVIRILAENDLKITPQRTAVLEVIMGLDTHPTADEIVDYIRLNFPHVPFGTVYKILDAFLKKGIIQRVKTGDDTIRFDAITKPHHHLYCEDSERIEDYYDDELNKMIGNYFKKKKIPDFTISDFKLQIIGRFKDVKKNQN
jgi:Fur family transcriptional regulator, peroxide stress response regulator